MPKAKRLPVNRGNTLEEFSDIIKRQGEENRRKDDEILAKAKKDLPKQILSLEDRADVELLDLYDNALNGGYRDPRLLAVLETWKKAIRKEIEARMEDAHG